MITGKYLRIFLLLCIILILFCIPPSACGPLPEGDDIGSATDQTTGRVTIGWQTEDIDGTAAYGRYSSLSIDSMGLPHIVTTIERNEFDSSLVYAIRERGKWKTELVDDESCVLSNPRIATDRLGRPHVVYGYLIDGWSANYALKYAYRNRFGWHIENISTLGQTGPRASIAVDAAGRPRIVYTSYPEGSLMYAEWDGAGWQTEEIDPDPSSWPVLRLDRQGEPHVVYTYLPDWFTREKRYATWHNGEWSIRVLDQEHSGQFTGFDIDILGNPHVAFVRSGELVYHSRDARGWHEEVITAAPLLSEYVDLAINRNGVVGINYGGLLITPFSLIKDKSHRRFT